MLCDTGWVIITVTPVNDPPVAVNDTVTFPEDTNPHTICVATNDTDIEGGILTVSLGTCAPQHGTATQIVCGLVSSGKVTVSFTATGGSFTGVIVMITQPVSHCTGAPLSQII